jgi:hypothetical protein
MNRKEFIETAISAAKVFGDLHYSAILDAKETVRELGDIVVDSLNDWYSESTRPLSEYSTKELYEELLKREGIREIQVGMGERVEIFDKRGSLDWVEGPARLLINID